nr:zinc finger, GRF-type [Ipomoea batatas]
MHYHCDESLNLRTSWTNDNPGRRYWNCGQNKGRGGGRCGFVRWYDPPMCSRSKTIIPGLLSE